MAERFDDNWDLVRVADQPIPEPPPLDLAPVLIAGRELLASCRDVGPGDSLAAYGQEWLPPWLETLDEAVRDGCDELDLLELVQHGERPDPGRLGGNAWSSTVYGSSKVARDALKGLVSHKQEGSVLASVRDRLVEPILARLGDELARFTLHEAEARRRSGRLTFHDLLVLCRAVVRDPVHGLRVRSELAQRYQALLLDEYQDTDPLQLDIVRAIAVPPEAGDDGPPRPGQLFFVGDPKQSLYRFRRADIDLFLRTPDLVAAEPVSLTSNFRSTPPLIDWINHVFGQLITHTEADDGSQAQPDFEALSARPTTELVGSPVTVLGAEAHPPKTLVGAVRQAEAVEVAALIDRIVQEGWEVRPPGGAPPVPARRRDIAILIPARTVLGHLETALREAGIPYRLDTGSLVYAADEVRTLLLALRVIDDPTDDLAVVSVLRSPLYGCSDVDLYRWRRQRGGTWSALAPRPERLDGDDPVWDGLADLGARIEARSWRTPSEQLDGLVRDRRVLETALAGSSPLDAWHRVRFVIEQARAWSDAGGRFLRDYLDWTKRQTGLTGRVAEAVLDDESVAAHDRDEADGREARRRRGRGPGADRPRRQGPGVPDRRSCAVSTVRAAAANAACRSPSVPTARGCGCGRGWSSRASTPRGPSTSRWTSTSASASSTWPAPAPATTSRCRSTAWSPPRRSDGGTPARSCSLRAWSRRTSRRRSREARSSCLRSPRPRPHRRRSPPPRRLRRR